MASCPQCKMPLTVLRRVQSGDMIDEMSADGVLHYVDGFKPDNKTYEWRCPVCGLIIVYSQVEAVAFLQGRKQ